MITKIRRINLTKITSGAVNTIAPITHIAVGDDGLDSNGEPKITEDTQTSLFNEIARYPIKDVVYPIETTARYTINIGENASGNYSTALGDDAKANGNYSIAVGYNANSTNLNSTAIGDDAKANGNYSIALGMLAKASGDFSVAVGYTANTIAANTIQLGNSSALSTLSCRVALTVTSDERDKIDISDLEKSLEFLSKVKTATYVFNHRNDYVDESIDETIEKLEEKRIVKQDVHEFIKNIDGEIVYDPELGIETVVALSDDEQEVLTGLLDKKAKRRLYGLYDYDREAHEKGTKKHTRKRVGVLAQQVQEAMIETFGTDNYADLIVDTMHDLDSEEIPDGVENIIGVNYQSFIPFLIDGVSRLWDINKSLEKRVKELEEKINE